MDLFTDEMRRNPFPIYDQLRAAAPVFHFAPADVWMLLDYATVKRALDDVETFSSRARPPTGAAPDWLIFNDPPRHTKLRALIVRAFTPRSIAALEPRVRALSAALLAAVRARGEMDLVADYAGPLPTMVIAEMLGIPLADRARFMRWSEAIVGLGYAALGGEVAARALAEHAVARQEIEAYLPPLLDARRRAPADDLLSRLVAAELDGERLTGEELLGFFQLLLAAGTETTTNLVSNAAVALFEHPDLRARLAADPARWPQTIEEVLRWRTPVQMIFRETRRDVELGGRVVPRDKLILVMVGAANRDPAVFVEPGRFDVDRAPNPHLAFGHGIHFCLGAALSRLEARVALPELFALEGLRPASQAPWPPRRALAAHGPASLPVRFAPR